jgi:hypothetical protein
MLLATQASVGAGLQQIGALHAVETKDIEQRRAIPMIKKSLGTQQLQDSSDIENVDPKGIPGAGSYEKHPMHSLNLTDGRCCSKRLPKYGTPVCLKKHRVGSTNDGSPVGRPPDLRHLDTSLRAIAVDQLGGHVLEHRTDVDALEHVLASSIDISISLTPASTSFCSCPAG